jgi:threonine dehydrogenase-like Zn-dependent dehydrogenase
MRTLRLHGLGDLRIHEEPDPLPAAGEALFHVKAVGLCGSDLHWFHEGGIGDARLDRPLILGHEFAGVTEEGERVAVDPSIACGQCSYCLRGDPNLCENLLFAGHGAQDGALREQMAWPRRCLFPLPDRLSDVDGLMLEPLGVALHAVERLCHPGWHPRRRPDFLFCLRRPSKGADHQAGTPHEARLSARHPPRRERPVRGGLAGRPHLPPGARCGGV